MRIADDRAYLTKLQDYYTHHRVLPSYTVIGSLVGLSSRSSVAALVKRLKRQGYLNSLPGGRLMPSKRFFERPWAEGVRAGFPSPAAEVLRDSITIDQYLVERPSQTVLVTVQGDSMVEAGIHPGDIVLVERRPEAKVGDIVVAIVDREFTIKYLAQEGRTPVLQPANPAYAVIRPKGELQIFGVVVGLIRKYQRSPCSP